MNSIDEDAIDVLGINPDIWRKYRRMTDPKYVQQEFERIVSPIDDKEAFERHKLAMARRAFAWYRLSKKKDKSRLVDIYNKICLLKKERD